MKLIRVVVGMGILLSMIVMIPQLVYADLAPVYDAESLERQFQSSLDQGSELPMPPPPGQEDEFFPREAVQETAPPSMVVMSTAERLRRVEQQIQNMQSSDQAKQFVSLQTEVQSLRGELERLDHQFKLLAEQQKKLQIDIDERFQKYTSALSAIKATDAGDKVNTKSNISKSTSELSVANNTAKQGKAIEKQIGKNESQPNVAEEQKIYQTAYTLIKNKKYNDAVNALRDMLKKYPSGQFASNAHYWLGELYGLLGKHKQALNEFTIVVNKFPKSPRVSDSQLKIGLIYAAQLNFSKAKLIFKKIVNRYPGSEASKIAQEQLKQIKQAGH